MVGESARNPDMAEGFRSFWAERRRFAADIVRHIVGPEQPAEQIERLVDRLVGPIYYRLLLSGDVITDEYLWELVLTIPWHDDPS